MTTQAQKLLNVPSIQPTYNAKKPLLGTQYSLDEQCRLIMGPTSNYQSCSVINFFKLLLSYEHTITPKKWHTQTRKNLGIIFTAHKNVFFGMFINILKSII